MTFFALRVRRASALVLAFSLFTESSFAAPDGAPGAPEVDDQTRSSARDLATAASDAYRRGDFAAAYDGFNRAFRLVFVPALGVWSARSLRQMNRYVEAAERYRDVLKLELPADAPESYRTSRKEAEAELAELLPKIPTLLLQVENPGGGEFVVRIGESEMPSALLGAKQKLNPGTHHIVASRGDETLEYDLTLGEREAKELLLRFDAPRAQAVTERSNAEPTEGEAPPPVASGGSDTLAWIGIGSGGALLVAGGILTFVALDKQSAMERVCESDGRCPTSAQADLDTFNTLAPLSTVGLVAGGVLAGAGIGLLLFGGESPKEPSVSFFTTPRSVGFRGAF